MTRKPCVDEAHRRRVREDLGTSLAVEAAAGAGKTTELVTRLLDLIRAGKAPLDRIVAVTFTEKAAGELKMRVREEIEEALAGRLDEASRGRFRDALEALGHAPIGTIHSFCAGLLRERPVEAGVDPQFQMLDELEGSLLRERAWSEWLEGELARANPALLRAVAHGLSLEGDRNTNSIYQLALKMLGCRDLLAAQESLVTSSDMVPAEKGPGAVSEEVPGPFSAEAPDVGPFMAHARGGLAALVSLLDDACDAGRAAVFRSQMEDARRSLILAEGLDAIQREAAVMRLNLHRRLPGKSHWAPQDAHGQAKAIFEDLKQQHDALAPQIGAAVAAGVARALVGFLDAYRAAKDDEGLLDFDDLLLLTRNMLRDSRPAREHFKGRYDFLLVDEFQDTDPLQVEIVFFLAERPGRHAASWDDVEVEPGKLFVVGDPKQSIYRFRRADIEIYEKAKRALREQGAELTLSQSFRPVPGLAKAVNALFEPHIKPPEDGGLYQPSYVALDPYRDAASDRPAAVLLQPPPGHDDELEHTGAARQLEARCVAAMIRRIVEEERWAIGTRDRETGEWRQREARYGDIAILAERFTFSDTYAEALADADVPLRVIGGRHFYMSHEVHSLVAVLKAIDNPHDRLSLVAALRGPFFGASDDDLLLAKRAQGTLSYLAAAGGTPVPPSVAAATAVLREFHERRNAEPISLLLQRLYERTKALELFLLRPRGEQRVANLLKIAERARAVEATQRVSFRGFVRWLARLHETEAREAESPSSEAGDDYVQFLSVHGAKGLEFPIVFLADMTKRERGTASFVVLRDRPPSEGQFAFYLGGKDDGFRTPNWPGEDYERRREGAEDARRFYVAATRARDYLLLLAGWAGGSSGPARFLADAAEACPPHFSACDTSTLDLAERSGRPFRVRLPSADRPTKATERRLAARASWRQAVGNTLAKAAAGGVVAKSPSRLGHGLEPAPAEAEARAGADLGRQIGSLVHHALRRAGLDDAATLEAMLDAEARRLGLPAPAAEEARRLLRAALDSPLLRRARAADACYHEVPFALEVDGVLLAGAIDLLFVEGGEAVVVDFKTDRVRSEAEVAARAAAYGPQVRAYALAAHRILCKPVKEVVLSFPSAGRLWRITPDPTMYQTAVAEVTARE